MATSDAGRIYTPLTDVIREFLDVPLTQIKVIGGENDAERRGAKVEIPACPCCGGPIRIIERFEGPGSRRYPACKPDGW